MPTPTMSLRALPEHHQMIRRMARALMERPELVASLTALIDGVTQDVTQNATRPSPAVDQRFEDIERRLDRLEGQAVSHGEAPDVLPAIQPAIQDLLLAIQQRQMQQEETTRKVMAFTHSINDRVIEALGQPTEPKAVTQQHGTETTPPKPAPLRPRAIPAEHVEEAARLWDGGNGPSFSQIVAMKGWPHAHKGLNKAVRKYLQRTGQPRLWQARPGAPSPPVT